MHKICASFLIVVKIQIFINILSDDFGAKTVTGCPAEPFLLTG